MGKIGMIQVLRYTESPVGPYDELLIIPGFFEYENEGEKEEGVRVSRIYVSQKYTCWNGRVSKFSLFFIPSGVPSFSGKGILSQTLRYSRREENKNKILTK